MKITTNTKINMKSLGYTLIEKFDDKNIKDANGDNTLHLLIHNIKEGFDPTDLKSRPYILKKVFIKLEHNILYLRKGNSIEFRITPIRRIGDDMPLFELSISSLSLKDDIKKNSRKNRRKGILVSMYSLLDILRFYITLLTELKD